jgi:hypothetical protein
MVLTVIIDMHHYTQLSTCIFKENLGEICGTQQSDFEGGV